MGIFTNAIEDDVLVTATFPEENPFGLIVNGEQNKVLLHLINQGTKNYTLVSASASFHDPTNHWSLIKNATTLKYNVPLVSGANFSAPYTAYSEFRPQEVGFSVFVNLAESGTTDVHRLTALNQTTNIVEPAGSWFDPQLIFLWLVIGTALLGGAYAAYNAFFPGAAKSGKKKSGLAGPKKVKAVVPGDGTEEYPSVKPYEEEWIPAQHLKSRSSKLRKGDAGLSSGGEELTSGGETSGTEVKGRKKKGGKKA
ncbi:hypothetical protein IAT38_002869 [Cryptococcus sp. DSM 104549]